MKVPFVAYADFDSFIQPMDSCDGYPNSNFTKQCQMHKPSNFCYYIKCFDDKIYSQDPVMYTAQHEDENIAQIFVDMLEENIKNMCTRFDKPKKLIFGEKEKLQYQTATEYWICGGEFDDNETKVRDHCHFSGKFRG